MLPWAGKLRAVFTTSILDPLMMSLEGETRALEFLKQVRGLSRLSFLWIVDVVRLKILKADTGGWGSSCPTPLFKGPYVLNADLGEPKIPV